MDAYRLANRIRSFRKLKGFTQTAFARHLGVSLAVLGEIERGNRQPSEELLQAITTALGITKEELISVGYHGVNG